MHLSRIRLLQRGDDPHQGGLACTIRPEQTKHAGLDGKRHIIQGARAVRIGFRELLDAKLHAIHQTTCRAKSSWVLGGTLPLGKVDRTILAASRVAPPSMK